MKFLMVHIWLWSHQYQGVLSLSLSSWWQRSLVWWNYSSGEMGSLVVGTQMACCPCVCPGSPFIKRSWATETLSISFSQLQNVSYNRLHSKSALGLEFTKYVLSINQIKKKYTSNYFSLHCTNPNLQIETRHWLE